MVNVCTIQCMITTVIRFALLLYLSNSKLTLSPIFKQITTIVYFLNNSCYKINNHDFENCKSYIYCLILQNLLATFIQIEKFVLIFKWLLLLISVLCNLNIIFKLS